MAFPSLFLYLFPLIKKNEQKDLKNNQVPRNGNKPVDNFIKTKSINDL